MNPVLRFLLLLIFGSPKEYRIPKGGNVLVIEVAKHYVRYFKLQKPTRIGSSRALRSAQQQGGMLELKQQPQVK